VLSQVKAAPQLSLARIGSHLEPLVTALGRAASGQEHLLKSYNSSLLHSTRNKDAKVKVAALRCIQVLWDELGDELLPEVPESVPFLVECLEEGETEVETATRAVVSKIESELGESLAGYMS
jgi:U3 small nucleolar RNA-associated protein 10